MRPITTARYLVIPARARLGLPFAARRYPGRWPALVPLLADTRLGRSGAPVPAARSKPLGIDWFTGGNGAVLVPRRPELRTRFAASTYDG